MFIRPKIRLLPPEVVHRIAAGEVVENPASVIRELTENSLDSGASSIVVRIVEGGLKLIEVEDNGCGMTKEDLESCCQRHGTSKISNLEDLDNIESLGFRGEALAALSAVSKIEISSNTKQSILTNSGAWELKRYGLEFVTQPTSRTQGTTVRVKEIFFNTPARLKFLKSTSSEASRCLKVMKEVMAANPSINFKFYALDASGQLEVEVEAEAQDFSQRTLLVLDEQNKSPAATISRELYLPLNGVKKFSFCVLSAPNFLRNSKDLFFVVNGRCIDDKRLPYVVREAFGGQIEMGKYPRGVFRLTLDANIVDVNVHPQKREVRWAKEFPVYSLIFESLRAAIVSDEKLRTPVQAPYEPNNRSDAFIGIKNVVPESFSFATPSGVANAIDVGTEPIHKILFRGLKVVGEIGAAWLICESPEGIIIVDQHAAHERVNFQKYFSGDVFPSTPLLIPLNVKLPLALKGRGEEFLRRMEAFGFEGKVMNDSEIEFVAKPKAERSINWPEVFFEIFSAVDEDSSGSTTFSKLKNWIASSLACHGSVRRGQRLSDPEIHALLCSLDEVNWNEFCPHGRPTYIQLTHEQLEEKFHRS